MRLMPSARARVGVCVCIAQDVCNYIVKLKTTGVCLGSHDERLCAIVRLSKRARPIYILSTILPRARQSFLFYLYFNPPVFVVTILRFTYYITLHIIRYVHHDDPRSWCYYNHVFIFQRQIRCRRKRTK